MVGSMDVLKDMPEAEDRAATLRELQERLQALLQPKLLQVCNDSAYLRAIVSVILTSYMSICPLERRMIALRLLLFNLVLPHPPLLLITRP